MRISRRTIVMSPLAALVLRPFADFINARAEGPTLPGCFVVMQKCQGLYPQNHAPNWIPTMAGGELQMSPVLASLEPIRKHLTIVQGVDYTCFNGNDPHWSHNVIYTGADTPPNGNGGQISPSSESIDQYVAARWGVPSLHLDVGSWPGHKNDKTASFRKAPGSIQRSFAVESLEQEFKSIFGSAETGGGDPKAAADRLKAIDASERSLLDSIKDDITALRGEVVGSHKVQLDAHLEGFRDVEKKILRLDQGMQFDPKTCSIPTSGEAFKINTDNANDAYTKIPQDRLRERWDLQINFLLLAMRCGMRRVLLMTATHDDNCGLRPPFWDKSFERAQQPPEGLDNVGSYHFALWHGSSRNDGGAHIRAEKAVTDYFAKLLLGMAAIPSGETNLLENSLAVYGANMSTDHNTNGHSFLVAGNAGGRVPGNRLMKVGTKDGGASGKPHNDLLVSLLQAAGFPDVKTFGAAKHCTGGLPGFLKA
ncbi:MAG: DUF1552 domain-containing protein [Silvanigrellales bacterium]|nr:DUF1552 domain-containing protein [Silvanigrellales bacterium]